MEGETPDAVEESKDEERHAPQSSEVNTMEAEPAAAEDEENIAREFLSDLVDLIASAEEKLASPGGAAAEADAVIPEEKSPLILDENNDTSAVEVAARPLQEEKLASPRSVAVVAEADAVISEEKSPLVVDGNNNDPSAMEVSSEVTDLSLQEEKLESPQVCGAAVEAAEADTVIPEEKSPLVVDGNNNDPSGTEVSSEVSDHPFQDTTVEQHGSVVSVNGGDKLCVENTKDIVTFPPDAAAKNLQEIATSLAKVDIKSVDEKCDIFTVNTSQDLSSIQAGASVVACEVSSKFSSSNEDAIGKKEETVGDVSSPLLDEPVSLPNGNAPLDVPSSPKAVVRVKEETTSPQSSSIASVERPSIAEANLRSVKFEALSPGCCLTVDAEVNEVSSEICQNLGSDSTLQVRNPPSQSPKQEIGELKMEFQESSSCPDDQSNPIVSLQSIDELVDNDKNAINNSAKVEAPHKSVSNELFEGPIGYENPDNFDDSQYVTPVIYGCSVCFTIVGCTRESFIRHQKEYHWISLQCKVCKRKFSTTKGYENHMTTHIRYPCLHCPKEFRHQLEVEDHQGQHFSNKLFRCDRCGEEFYLRATLMQHRSFMGEKCPEILSNVHKIQEQLSSTQYEELVKCRSGCKLMIPKSMMKAHIKDHADKIQEAHNESRKRAKRVRLESDV
ncbi:hypothetical protein ONE63_001810 [Megalurothrips usitatus]|uniref:C2H2-type domain-containing protein n=1 Tax=Megalurothrips usitatus TaxID=439358 RepID=A0AAV7XGU0_9NEOP|nr:hypothetical protein ONE63_001810 [Megalurothrips usitatus]